MMTPKLEKNLESVLESIEAKLETLEANRDEVHKEVAIKRAQIRELTETIELLHEMDASQRTE